MCAVYEICGVCGVDHYYDRSKCRWPLTDRTVFYLELHPDNPIADAGLRRIEEKIDRIVGGLL